MELIGIDIGASNLKAGRIVKGLIAKKSFLPVKKEAGYKELITDLFQCIDKVITTKTEKIGIGVPAIVDHFTGVAYDVQNILSWKKIPLKEIVQKQYNLPVSINNDANCFAIGEKIYGKGSNYNNFVGLTLGTGIGMGIIINSELYNGVLCGAGEIGMVSYKDSIIENYASSFFFSSNYSLSPKELFLLAEQGNKEALKAFDEYGYHLGETIKNILHFYAPEAIILGGSISHAYQYFKNSVEETLKTFAYQKQIEKFNLETSNLTGSGILGAAALCFQQPKK